MFRENRRESYAQGPGCLLQEVQALYSDPRIDLKHLAACTVLIVHGTEDKIVPVNGGAGSPWPDRGEPLNRTAGPWALFFV